MKVGRNEKCPCGSGKKYKHCCDGITNPFLSMVKAEDSDKELTAYKKLRHDLNLLNHYISLHTQEVYGQKSIVNASADCALWSDAEFFDSAEECEHAFAQFQLPYFLFQWAPQVEGEANKGAPLFVPPAVNFAQSRAAKKLSPELKEVLKAAIKHPFSFFEIKEVKAKRGMKVQEIFSEIEYFVFDAAGSVGAQKGTLLFSRLVEYNGICCFDGSAPFPMLKEKKLPLIDLKKRMMGRKKTPLTWDKIEEWKSEIYYEYKIFIDSIVNPTPPTIVNRDGDKINFQTLHFEIENAHEAAHALKDLCVHADPNEALALSSKFNESGKIIFTEIAWTKLDKIHQNTGLGHIKIDGKKLSVSVNSDNRAEKFKELMAQRLPHAKFKTIAFETSVEGLLEKGRAEQLNKQKDSMLDPNKNPEIKKMLEEQLERHWNHWPDTPLPALGNLTPREAVKTKFGREKVIALLESFEERTIPHMPPHDFGKVKKSLGLEL